MIARKEASTRKTTAARKLASKARSSRRQSVVPVSSLPQAIEDAIELERERLMRAHTLLSCAALAMDAEDLSFEGPHYVTVIEMSRDIVNQAINNLEPMNLESAARQPIDAVDEPDSVELGTPPRRSDRVREMGAVYLIH